MIAGEALGQKAVIETHTPIMYLHFTINPGGEVNQPVPSVYNAFVAEVKSLPRSIQTLVF